MRRIDEILNRETLYTGDVERLKETISELRTLSNSDVEKLYSSFSDGVGASWLMLDEYTIEQFRYWLD